MRGSAEPSVKIEIVSGGSCAGGAYGCWRNFGSGHCDRHRALTSARMNMITVGAPSPGGIATNPGASQFFLKYCNAFPPSVRLVEHASCHLRLTTRCTLLCTIRYSCAGVRRTYPGLFALAASWLRCLWRQNSTALCITANGSCIPANPDCSEPHSSTCHCDRQTGQCEHHPL